MHCIWKYLYQLWEYKPFRPNTPMYQDSIMLTFTTHFLFKAYLRIYSPNKVWKIEIGS